MKNSFVSKSMTPVGGEITPPAPAIWDDVTYTSYTVNNTHYVKASESTVKSIVIDVSELTDSDTVRVTFSEGTPTVGKMAQFTDTVDIHRVNSPPDEEFNTNFSGFSTSLDLDTVVDIAVLSGAKTLVYYFEYDAGVAVVGSVEVV